MTKILTIVIFLCLCSQAFAVNAIEIKVKDSTAAIADSSAFNFNPLYWGGGFWRDKLSVAVRSTAGTAYCIVDNEHTPGQSVDLWLSSDGQAGLDGGNVQKYVWAMPESLALSAGTDETVQTNNVYVVYNSESPAMWKDGELAQYGVKGELIDSMAFIADIGLGAVSGTDAEIRYFHRDRESLYKNVLRTTLHGWHPTYHSGIEITAEEGAHTIAMTRGFIHSGIDNELIPAASTDDLLLYVPIYADSNYARWDSLDNFDEYSDGSSIDNPHYFWVVIWGAINEDTTEYKLYMNIQDGSDTYFTLAQAQQDQDNMIPTTIPDPFHESGFLIAGLIIRGSNDEIQLVGSGSAFVDLRKFVSGTGGAGTGTHTDSIQIAAWTFVISTTPTFITSITTPLVIGGTETTSDLTLKTTSGVGTDGADMHFLVGNDGATEAMKILNDGTIFVGIPSLQTGSGDTAIVNITTADPGRMQLGEPDIHFGDSSSGFIETGMARFGMHSDTTYNSGALDVSRTVFFINEGYPTGNFEFLFCETTGNAIRLGIPKSGAGLGMWSVRSFFCAGPSVYDDDAATGAYWGFDSLAMATDVDGADLGVQNDVQILGELYVDSIKSSGQTALNIDQDVVVPDIFRVNSGEADSAYVTQETVELEINDSLQANWSTFTAGDLIGWGLTTDNDSTVVDATDFDESADFISLLTDETGTGVMVFGTSPTITTGINLPANSVSDDEIDEGDSFEWTGIQDLSAATFTFPNSNNPTTNSVGDAAVDANDDALEVYITAESQSALIPFYDDKAGTIIGPDGVNDTIIVKHFDAIRYPHGVEIVRTTITVRPDAAYTLTLHEYSSAWEKQATMDSIVQASGFFTGDNTPMNATLDANDYLTAFLPSTEVGQLHIEVYFLIKEGN